MSNNITTIEAAALLGMTRQHVAWLVKQGKLTGTKRGRDYWIDRASVEAYQATIAAAPRRGRPKDQRD